MAKSDSRKGTQSIGDAIRSMLNNYRIESKFDQTNIVASWEKLVGKPIARKTRKIFIRNKVLYVAFDSPSVTQDFMLHKDKILAVFQAEFGPDSVKDIAIL